MSGPVFKWNQGALLGGLGCVWCRAWRVWWDQYGLLILKGEPARQLVDHANLSWNWSALRAIFVLKAGQSWVKLNIHECKRLRGFTARVSFTRQTNKQTNKSPECRWNPRFQASKFKPASKHPNKGGYTPRRFTSLPAREAEYSFSGFITTNKTKQTNKQTHKQTNKFSACFFKKTVILWTMPTLAGLGIFSGRFLCWKQDRLR